MSVSHLLAPRVQPAWMKSTATAVSVPPDTPDLAVRTVSTRLQPSLAFYYRGLSTLGFVAACVFVSYFETDS